MKKLGLNLKNAFTLAEVIIVLGIIGIVAELTLPDLISNYQKQIYVTHLQKITSVLSQGFKQIIISSGCYDIPCSGIFDGDELANIKNANVFKILNTCAMNETGCYDVTGYKLDKTAATIIGTKPVKIVFADGSVVSLYNVHPTCDYIVGYNKYSSVCVRDGIIDVNGTKSPNMYGRDIFRFYLSREGLILPAGTSDDTNINYWNTVGNTNSCLIDSGEGHTCFGRIIEEGWQMKY